ncbi:RsbT co-antagonist protein RsbRA [Enhygromyxa salina]|uniref:RsbT co-antagonist protein RsbRA n=1 Tax=Enhygromyxa salina TaxID=215803 RepID=A0A2S9XQI5_9BACT|nr:RsbT co-antagonist protein RsbRA [Enhygromyxa salina]
MSEWLDSSRAHMTEALGQRLSARASSVFKLIGAQASRDHVKSCLDALREDLQTGKHEAQREAVQKLVEDLTARGLSFSDLRFYVTSLRTAVLEAAAGADVRQQLDAWFFDFVMVCAMQFVVHRDEQLEHQSAKREVQHLESQLVELQLAMAEKTNLLEQIRQVSTPVVPVVEGILVVPLVGVFDSVRAELLTERLLHEVAQTKARSVILDISGVPVVDNEAAQLILRLARAVGLLGAELSLVGVAPATARTIVDLGLELNGLKAMRTLKDGLAQALARRRLRIAPF